MKEVLKFVVLFICVSLLPILVYFCVKFGTVAFYKAKQFIDKQKTGDTSNEQAKEPEESKEHRRFN